MDKAKQKKSEEQGYLGVMHFLGSTARTIHDGFQNIFPQETEKQSKVDTKSCKEIRKPALEKTEDRITKKVETCPDEPESLLTPEDTVLPAKEEPSFKEAPKDITMPQEAPLIVKEEKALDSSNEIKKEHKKARRLDNPLFEMTSKPVSGVKKKHSTKAK